MVPRLWPDATVVCVASGPSLTAEDVAATRGQARVIAVNDGYRLAPWADALYATDPSWWLARGGVPEFGGSKWSVEHAHWDGRRDRWPDVTRLTNTGEHGLEGDPSGLRHGSNSGYAAVNLAVHFGARQIVLLGYDMGHQHGQPSHFFGNHTGALNQRSPYDKFIQAFETLVAPLQALGIPVWNCSRSTALTCFPRVRLDAVFPAAVPA